MPVIERRELILYATPAGPLAAGCDDYFSHASARGPTVAQRYPPHCTLTGFFHREPHRVPEIVDAVQHLIASNPAPDDAVQIVGLHLRNDWIGLELSSAWLLDLTSRFVDTHQLDDGDDALRPKTWLHLSLAYGVDDLTPYRSMSGLVPLTAPSTWDVALWARDNNRWTRL